VVESVCIRMTWYQEEIDHNLVEKTMVKRMKARSEIGSLASSTGSLEAHIGSHILENEPKKDYWTVDSDEVTDDGTYRRNKWDDTMLGRG